ncbi:rhamnogalacturonate lyase [Drechslerella dactyloides]|uniref:rhamnogalacturonan endolyase n=1 Tax=Drechslerella dactyloides TaxID=74499 RepID=A0AAD6NJ74_DREDA|nr:rhamnogalacturonate lyase [Drechslerella dactyloides]
MKFNGVEYQDGSVKYTQINSGLGSSTVSGSLVSGYTKITIQSSGNPVTQYIVSKSGDNTMYLATYITGEVDPGELRWLARLKKSLVPTGPHNPASNVEGGSAIEGSDVYLVGGQTRSKFYSSDRFIEDNVHGVTGSGVGIWMIIPPQAYETSSGGPFMRDINTQGGSTQELYWYMNSGHVRTEPWRMGLKGPYAMTFTTGSTPSANIDTSFFSSLSVNGYVAQSGRGRVSGTVSGIPSGFEGVVHWYNSNDQYWVKSTGSFTSPYMKPGTYTMKLYKGELEVASTSVTVSAGGTTSKSISSTESSPSVVWRVGQFDGQPFELKNGNNFLRMHPSDPRMSSWGGTYTVGSSSANAFPMAIWKSIGGNAVVKFTLSSSQLVQMTLRIGTTLSFAGGRPSVTINSWSGSVPAAPSKIDSRGVTRGAYRGYGEQYTWTVPASAFVSGTNTLTIGVASGSNGADYLSPNFIFDAVELQGPGSSGSGTTTSRTTTATTSTWTTTTSSRTTTTTAGGGGGSCTVSMWGQCGGINYTGCTTCVSGATCTYSNEYYSQCL